METLITRGIKISVETFYQHEFSSNSLKEFIHHYRITIENNSSDSVQLMRRHWYIWDSKSGDREVEGPGVIGEQPILRPGESHQYVSMCNLSSEVGRMHGTYLMQNQENFEMFEVDIPVFKMIAPQKLN